MKIIIDKNKNIYQMIAQELMDLVNDKKDAILGLATGSTPMKIYEYIVKDYQNTQRDYSLVKTINLDEYADIDVYHTGSYHSYMVKHLFSQVNINLKHTYFPSLGEPFTEFIEKNIIDMQLLGLGRNGHIGFNEPGTSFDSLTHKIELNDITRRDNARFFNHLADVPTHAITLGIKDIMQAKKIILIATGKHKSKAVKNMIEGPVTEDCPASILQLHPNVFVYLDEAAASLIKK